MSEQLSDELIYRGFWINWSQGRVLGATITTSPVSANAIIAVIAVLVSVAVGHLWNLLLFLLHQHRATVVDGDAVFQQEQVILRSLPKPASVVTDTLKLIWAWRMTKTTRHMKRTWLVLLLAVVFYAGAIAASIFSSKVISVSNIDVLSAATNCMIDVDVASLDAPPLYFTNIVKSSLLYARNCYGTEDTSPGCNSYVQPRIPLSQRQVPCPFPAPDFCAGSSPTAVALDSGLVDSNDVLGINAPYKDRIFFRKLTTYVPVKMQGHYSLINYTHTGTVTPYGVNLTDYTQAYAFQFGQLEGIDADPNSNTTLLLDTFRSYTRTDYGMHPLESRVYLQENDPNTVKVDVLPELYVPDADVAYIFILTGNVYSRFPIDDPVFSAHRPRYCSEDEEFCQYTPDDDHPTTLYYSDYPAGLMMALVQFQMCLSDDSGKPSQCTSLTSAMNDRVQDLLPSANEAQMTTLKFIAHMSALFDLWIGLIPEISPLKASQGSWGGSETAFPKDQWVQEAVGLESWVWAALQQAISGHATGWNMDPLGMILAKTDAEKHLCSMQKVHKSGGFANINVFGLAFIVGMSGILMIADICVLRIFIFLSKTRQALAPRVERWIQDGALQLQRRVYEDEGHGPWERFEHEVPIYNGEKLLPTMYSPRQPGKAPPPDSPLLFQTYSQQNDFKHEFKGELRSPVESSTLDSPLSYQKYSPTDFRHEIPSDTSNTSGAVSHTSIV